MASTAHDWMGATYCCEEPRPSTTFADMPPAYRREMLFDVFACAVSMAFVAIFAILARPLPSRSFLTQVVLPSSGISRPALLDSRPLGQVEQPAVRRIRERTLPAPAVVQAVSLIEAVPVQEKPRRNVFSRFVRGVLHKLQPAAESHSASEDADPSR
jgi:hypothetical protein